MTYFSIDQGQLVNVQISLSGPDYIFLGNLQTTPLTNSMKLLSKSRIVEILRNISTQNVNQRNLS